MDYLFTIGYLVFLGISIIFALIVPWISNIRKVIMQLMYDVDVENSVIYLFLEGVDGLFSREVDSRVEDEIEGIFIECIRISLGYVLYAILISVIFILLSFIWPLFCVVLILAYPIYLVVKRKSNSNKE